jgi:hypothetical protein
MVTVMVVIVVVVVVSLHDADVRYSSVISSCGIKQHLCTACCHALCCLHMRNVIRTICFSFVYSSSACTKLERVCVLV